MGKTERKAKTSDRSANQAREGKNPMVKPVKLIKMPSSPSAGHSSPRDRSMSHIKLNSQIEKPSEVTRPIEEITLGNARNDAEVKKAMQAINKSGKKIEDSLQNKKHKTWKPEDKDYTLEIDPHKQNAVIEDVPEMVSRKDRKANKKSQKKQNRETAKRLESTNASDWEDFPTENMPVLAEGIRGMQISKKKVSFDKGSEKNRLAQPNKSTKQMGHKTTHPSVHNSLVQPAHLKPIDRRTGERKEETHAPIKKTLSKHVNSLEKKRTTGETEEQIGKNRPSYSSENVLGYSESNPKTHSRATYYSIQEDQLKGSLDKTSQGKKALDVLPEAKSKIEMANRMRANSLAQTTRIVKGQNGLWQIQKSRKEDTVNKIFKSRRPAEKDPFLKRVQQKVNNRTGMNERAKESKHPSTYKQPQAEDE